MTESIDIDTFDRQVRDRIPMPKRSMAPVWWYGGKGNMVAKIRPLIPNRRVYVEPFCGAASLFWSLDPNGRVEVLNDLNGEIVNLFRVLQDLDKFQDLAHRITWTPYSLAEYGRAIEVRKDAEASDVDRAWATMVVFAMAFSGNGFNATKGTWSRAFIVSSGCAETANNWRKRMRMLEVWHDRISRAQIDNRDALDVIRYWDSDDTVFYVDPPYMSETRVKGSKNVYSFEMSDEQHASLIDVLLSVRGDVVLSGYGHPIYDRLTEAGWERYEFETSANAAVRGRGTKLRGSGSASRHAARTEVVWRKVRKEMSLYEQGEYDGK